MMKVAYVLSRFPHLTETFILREMLLLREMGYDVHVFSLFDPLPYPVHRQAETMLPYTHYSPLIRSRALLAANARFLLKSPLRYARALYHAVTLARHEPQILARSLLLFPKAVYFAQVMQQLGIEHIHAHFVWVNGIVAQVVADLIGVTVSLHPHAFGLFMRDPRDVSHQLALADGVITVSEYHRQFIADLCPRWSPEDIAIVHYGIDPQDFTPQKNPPPDDRIRILSVGSLTAKKGHPYLIEACAGLKERGIPFHCTIVGAGPQRETLAAQIARLSLQDEVTLAGAKPQAEVRDLYAHSDIFALACIIAPDGDRDGMPNVLLEAMAMQLPVVTTPVTGIPELVLNGETGLLVPSGDAAALAEALARLANDEDLRHRLGQRGRQKVIAEFDIHQTAARLADALTAIHGRQSAKPRGSSSSRSSNSDKTSSFSARS